MPVTVELVVRAMDEAFPAPRPTATMFGPDNHSVAAKYAGILALVDELPREALASLSENDQAVFRESVEAMRSLLKQWQSGAQRDECSIHIPLEKRPRHRLRAVLDRARYPVTLPAEVSLGLEKPAHGTLADVSAPGSVLSDQDLLERVQGGEGPLCELKASASHDKVKRAVVAFANTVRQPHQAVLFLGIGPDKRPSGAIADADKTQQEVVDWLASCYPPLDGCYELRHLTLGGKPVVAVVISESRKAPHFTGGAYVRVGSRNQLASERAFAEIVADQVEPARVLRPWLGKQIVVNREYSTVAGIDAWTGDTAARLVHLDPFGVILELDGDQISFEWGRVRLQPLPAGHTPRVLIRLA